MKTASDCDIIINIYGFFEVILLNNVTSHTKQLGIIGCPAEHSFSPAMHNYISSEMNEDYIYCAYNVEPHFLADAIAGMRALGIRGYNVTAPHKREVMKYLDVISEQARLLGSVNTVVNREGVLYGYNTDSDGFYEALVNAGIEVSGSRVLIMGCGGVVRPTLVRLIQAKPASVTVVNRTMEKAVKLSEELYKTMGFKVQTEFDPNGYDIVINTTSAGMEPQEDALPIDSIEAINGLDFIKPGCAAVDMIYNPSETLFLKEAKKRGAKILNGLDMLIYQGVIAYELFTGVKLPQDMAERIRKEVFGA